MLDLYTLYHFAERLYTGFSRHLPGGYALPPLQMVIELTYRCNLKCEMCFQRRQMEQLHLRPGGPAQELSLEEIQQIIAQTPPWCLIIFTGGEPFVRTDILDILAYAAQKRRCHVVTNGARITSEFAHALVDLRVLSIGFSIDGDRALHDRIRGVEGTFDRAIAAMREVRQHRQGAGRQWPLINFKTTITASNVRDLTHIVEVARQAGADYCTYQIVNTSLLTSGLQLNDEITPYFAAPDPIEEFDLEALRSQLQHLDQMRSDSGPTIRFSPNIPPQEIVAHYANKLDVRSYTCGAPWSGVNVSAYGDVFPCFNYRIGNLRENTLPALWNGTRYRVFRRALKRQGLFAGCVGCCDLVYRGNGKLRNGKH
jgi:MoaA/NifB/PqqE/SkfB family radical SAM enzyme